MTQAQYRKAFAVSKDLRNGITKSKALKRQLLRDLSKHLGHASDAYLPAYHGGNAKFLMDIAISFRAHSGLTEAQRIRTNSIIMR